MSHLDKSTLHALLDGELLSADARHASAHLEECSDCGARLDEVRAVRAESPAPVLLVPDLPDAVLVRQRRLRAIGWVATVVILAGAGYVVFSTLQQAKLATIAGPNPEQLWAAPPPGGEAAALRQPLPPASPTWPATAPSALPPETATGAAAQASGPAVDSAEPPAVPPTPPVQSEADRLAQEREAMQREAARLAVEREAQREAAERLAAEQLAAQRRAAAAAEQRRPAPPPTLEQRAELYLRIGLDEAVQQLGSPMHGIEGMSPVLVGLTQGGRSPGMDTTRPVVRAVYLDPAGRLILLDQQTLRAGQTGGAETWTRRIIGNVVVLLHGEPSADALRRLAGRIR